MVWRHATHGTETVAPQGTAAFGGVSSTAAMASMMDLMFPATSTPVVEKESRKDGTFAGALEP